MRNVFVLSPSSAVTLSRTLLVGLFAIGVVAPIRPCTTFDLVGNANIVLGRNYDYYAADGRVMVNRRGLQKTAFATNSGLQWVSRFGSLTFNQWGHEFPNGGINEAGLVVEMMMLDGTQYPTDSRPSLTELQWIQYQLDCSASVAEVLASDQRVRIQPGSIPLHFLVADRSGHCAAIEFLGGQRVCHTDSSLPVAVLSNDTYDSSLAYAATTSADRADHVSSLGRFVQAAASVRNFTQTSVADPISYAFSALANVNQPNWTRWTIIYDIGNLSVYFRTLPAPSIKQIQLGALDFRPSAPIRTMDINTNTSGEVTPQSIYSPADNLALLTSAYRQTPPLANVPYSYIQIQAAYPDSVVPVLLPSISAQPASRHVAPGGTAAFSVDATGDGPLTYQWKLNGAAIAGATNATYSVANVHAGDMGFYSVTIGNSGGTTDSDVAILTVAAGRGRLTGLSTRGYVPAGGSLTPGFYLRGSGSKSLIVRGVGPSLGGYGVTGPLSDPRMDLIPVGNATLLSNDDWGTNANLPALRAAMPFPLVEGSKDAAALTTLSTATDSGYTVRIVPSGTTAAGIALAEVYDLDATTSPVQFASLSTLGFTGTGENVLTPGFIITGDGPKQLLIRAVGPTLGDAPYNVPAALADPQFRVVPLGKDFTVASNDNWGGTATLQAAFAQTYAFALPTDSRDAAVVVRLPPGGYTVQATGVSNTTGNVLVEVYDMDP
jgi:choloylglycine hydrolase